MRLQASGDFDAQRPIRHSEQHASREPAPHTRARSLAAAVGNHAFAALASTKNDADRQPAARAASATLDPCASSVTLSRCALDGRASQGILPGGIVHPDVASDIARRHGRGAALDPAVRERIGGALGDPLGDVRVHTDQHADRLARTVDARAFTVGSDVFFADSEYRPGTNSGDRLLAHELAHVVQQRGTPSIGSLIASLPGDVREQQADVAARASASARPMHDHTPALARRESRSLERLLRNDYRSTNPATANARRPLDRQVREAEAAEDRPRPTVGPQSIDTTTAFMAINNALSHIFNRQARAVDDVEHDLTHVDEEPLVVTDVLASAVVSLLAEAAHSIFGHIIADIVAPALVVASRTQVVPTFGGGSRQVHIPGSSWASEFAGFIGDAVQEGIRGWVGNAFSTVNPTLPAHEQFIAGQRDAITTALEETQDTVTDAVPPALQRLPADVAAEQLDQLLEGIRNSRDVAWRAQYLASIGAWSEVVRTFRETVRGPFGDPRPGPGIPYMDYEIDVEVDGTELQSGAPRLGLRPGALRFGRDWDRDIRERVANTPGLRAMPLDSIPCRKGITLIREGRREGTVRLEYDGSIRRGSGLLSGWMADYLAKRQGVADVDPEPAEIVGLTLFAMDVGAWPLSAFDIVPESSWSWW